MNSDQPTGEAPLPVLTLFVAGSAPRSERARGNLTRMLAHIGRSDLHVHEIDMLAEPQEGLAYSVFATPTLLKMSATGAIDALYGDLSEPERLQGFLGDLAEDS